MCVHARKQGRNTEFYVRLTVHSRLDIKKPPFKRLFRDPTKENEKYVNDELKRLHKGREICDKTLSTFRLKAGSSRTPVFYGRVNQHKENNPLRPIVSSVGSCTCKVAKFVARVLAPYSREVS